MILEDKNIKNFDLIKFVANFYLLFVYVLYCSILFVYIYYLYISCVMDKTLLSEFVQQDVGLCKGRPGYSPN